MSLFLQDDWRIAGRLSLNAGVRYDVDFNMWLNTYHNQLLDDPSWDGLNQFVSRECGTDSNNAQPRIGATCQPFRSASQPDRFRYSHAALGD